MAERAHVTLYLDDTEARVLSGRSPDESRGAYVLGRLAQALADPGWVPLAPPPRHRTAERLSLSIPRDLADAAGKVAPTLPLGELARAALRQGLPTPRPVEAPAAPVAPPTRRPGRVEAHLAPTMDKALLRIMAGVGLPDHPCRWVGTTAFGSAGAHLARTVRGVPAGGEAEVWVGLSQDAELEVWDEPTAAREWDNLVRAVRHAAGDGRDYRVDGGVYFVSGMGPIRARVRVRTSTT